MSETSPWKLKLYCTWSCSYCSVYYGSGGSLLGDVPNGTVTMERQWK